MSSGNSSVSSVHAIYISGTTNSTIQGNTITTSGSGSYGVFLTASSNFNTFLNNDVTVSGGSNNVFRLVSSNSNNITGGSIKSTSSANPDYYLSDSNSNNFTNTNFTAARKIYFKDAISWFNYRNDSSNDIWLKASASAEAGITRTLVNWNNTMIRWNDTNYSASGITLRYNITGLLGNVQYNVYNTSAGTQTNPYEITTGSDGNLNFTIALNGNTEIIVNTSAVPDMPPSVTLNLPINNFNQTSASIAFNCTAYDDINLTNVTLYNSLGGTWQANGTNSSGINNSAYIFDRLAPSNGTFTWNCLAYDNSSRSSFASQNFTVTVDGVPPTAYSPPDNSYSQGASAIINWTLYDNYAPGQYIVYRNGTVQNQSAWANNTNLNIWISTSVQGTWNYTIAYNDSLGNSGISDTVIITVTPDATPPQITFVFPTWPNSSQRTENWAFINITLNEQGNASLLEWSNGTIVNYTMQGNGTNFYLNMTGQNGTIMYNVFANDTAGNMNVSETMTVTLNITSPPAMAAQWNSITSNDQHTLINTSTPIVFSITFDQTGDITWYKDDAEVSTNYSVSTSNYSTLWGASSSQLKSVKAKINNSNGASENVTWYVLVYDLFPATVTYAVSAQNDKIDIGAGSIDLPSIFNKLNNRSLFDYVGNKTFFMNSIEYSPNAVGTRLTVNNGAILYINDTTAREFRLISTCYSNCNTYTGTKLADIYVSAGGSMAVNNSKILSWDLLINDSDYDHSNVRNGSYRTIKSSISTATNSNAAINITNSEIYWLGGSGGTKGIVFNNVKPYISDTLFHGVYQIYFDAIPSDSVIDNNIFKNSYYSSLKISNSNNFQINNNRFVNTSIGTSNTLECMNCSYGIINNNTIDNTYWPDGWNGIQLGEASHHMTIQNSRFVRTNHNGIDMRKNVNYTVVKDSVFENFTASGANALIITMNNDFDGGAYHTLLRNIIVSNISNGKAILSWESANITIENMTIINSGYAFYFDEIDNAKVRDSTLTNSANSWKDFNIYFQPTSHPELNISTTAYALNNFGQNASSVYITNKGNITTFYYLDAFVGDGNNNSVENLIVNVVSDNIPYPIPNDFSTLTQSTTDSTGHTPNPLNETDTLIVVDFVKNLTSQYNYTYNISAYDPTKIWTDITHTVYPNGTVQQLQPLAQVIGINPDSSWYRPNKNNSTYTVNLTINYIRTNLTISVTNITNTTVNEYSSSKINFTAANTTANQKMNITVSNGVFPIVNGYQYIIKKDGVLQSTQTASAGQINFTDINVGSEYIIQPMVSITLISPQNAYLTNNATTIFNCSASSPNNLVNITLYGNFSGSWAQNGTANITGTSNSTAFVRTLADGSYIWNCLAYDNSGNYTFALSNSTLSIDTVKPTLANLTASSITTSSVAIAWNTNELSNSTIYYGTTIATTSNATNSTLATTHSVSLSGLTASTPYYYNLSSCDLAGNCNTSIQYSFTTSATPVQETPCTSCGGGGSSGGSSTVTQNKTNQTTSNTTIIISAGNTTNATIMQESEIKQKAQEKISEIKAKITPADVEAKEKLSEAESAYNAGDYSKAYNTALEAEELIGSGVTAEGEEQQKPGTPYFTYVVLAVIVIAVVYAFRKNLSSKPVKESAKELPVHSKPHNTPLPRATGKKQSIKPVSKDKDLDDIEKRLEEIKRKIGK